MLQTIVKGVLDKTWLGGNGNPLGISKKLNPIKCYTHKPEHVPVNETHKLHRDFEIQTDYLIPVMFDLVCLGFMAY